MNRVVLDIPRIYTALAEWSACLLYISLLRPRFSRGRFSLLAGAFLAIQVVFLLLTDNFPLPLWIPCMIIAIMLMFAFIYSSCSIRATDAAYFCVRAFVLAELAASLQWQVHVFLWPQGIAALWQRLALLLVAYGLLGAVVFSGERMHVPRGKRLSASTRELVNACIMGALVFGMSNMSFISWNTPFTGQFPAEILNIRTMVDLGGFAVLYAYHVQCCQQRGRRELEAVENILQTQYVQYQQSRESIDMINRKYHDLKHQITALRGEADPAKRSAWLDAMEQDIQTYEAQNKTGHPVLDTVLTGKSLYCQKHGITLTCVVDGTLLQFIDVVDLCTIFGNALDNAIECAKQLAEKEKRLIHVTVARQKSFALIRVENYYEGQLTFEEGLPVTTKAEPDQHGYGLKSIHYTVRKYGGTASVTTRNQWFELNILLPLPAGK